MCRVRVCMGIGWVYGDYLGEGEMFRDYFIVSGCLDCFIVGS